MERKLKWAVLLKVWLQMNKELRLSFDILKKVYNDKTFASIQLNKDADKNINFGLVTKIVYGVIENDIYLEYRIKQLAKNPAKPNTTLLLKIGIYVLENINSIPPYACINECVEMVKIESDKYVAGFVNATLKNVLKTPVVLPDKKESISRYLSIKYSYPEWLVKKLLAHKSISFVEEMLAKKLTTFTHIRILKDKEIFLKKLEEQNIPFEKSELENCLYIEYSKLVDKSDLMSYYTVQGLPSIISAMSLQVESGQKILDCTGAPGGKSGVIASINKDIDVTCCDIHSHRVLLVKQYMKKLGLENVTAIKQDATIYREEWKDMYDGVLCDVPCSGVGVINKKPDIMLNRVPQDITSLASTQYKILSNNAKYVKVGGVLVYSTCSILKEENEDVVNRFLKNNTNFNLIPIDTFGVEVSNDKNMYTFYPHVSNTEGFFIAKLERIK